MPEQRAGLDTEAVCEIDAGAQIAQATPNLEGATVLTEPPTEGAYTNEIVEAAIAMLGDAVDTTGDSFEAIDVTLEEGGA